VAVTKSELIEAVANRAPRIPRRDVEIIVNTVFKTMTDALARRQRIEIRGLGSFVARQRRARDGRNPRTGQKVAVPLKWVPFFTVGKELRERVNALAGGAAGPGNGHGVNGSPPGTGEAASSSVATPPVGQA
jgi:integration host factor subunit beta